MAGTKRSGRRPKPTNLLKLQGSWRSDRHATREIELPANIPEPPSYVKGIALQEWNRLVKLLAVTRCVTELDLGALAAYCVEYAKYTKVNEGLLEKDSMLVLSTKKTEMASPLLKASDRALNNMLRIAAEFGFTPAARRSLRIEPKIPEEDEKARFFKH